MYTKASDCLSNRHRISNESVDENQSEIEDLNLTTKENPRTGQWRSQTDFTLSMISATFGFGGIWIFPYLCSRYGGFAFIVMYIVTTIVLGIPIMFQEVAMGQYTGHSSMNMISMFCPILKGVGMASMVLAFLVSSYYGVVVSHMYYYLWASFSEIPNLPWNTCEGWWNTESCVLVQSNKTHVNENYEDARERNTSVGEFWKYRVLQSKSIYTKHEYGANLEIKGINDGLGDIRWESVVILMLIWTTICIVSLKRTYASRAFVRITTVLPYICLITILVRSLLLPGATKGILHLVHITNWKVLYDHRAWNAATSHMFFLYNFGYGVYPALASRNKFNHNFINDIAVCSLVQMVANIVSVLIAFSIMGYMSVILHTDINPSQIIGNTYAFITIPRLTLNLDNGVFWACLFFLMMSTLGLRSLFYFAEALTTGIWDVLPKCLGKHRLWFNVTVCLIMFTLGIPMCTQNGYDLLSIIDTYSVTTLTVGWVLLFQSLACTFEARRFCNCIQEMTKCRLSVVILLYWLVQAMKIIFIICIMWGINYYPLYCEDNYCGQLYPKWVDYFGFTLTIASMICIPAYFIYYIFFGPTNFIRRNLEIGIRSTIKNLGKERNEAFIDQQQQGQHGEEYELQ